MFEQLNSQEGLCYVTLDSWLFRNILSIKACDKLNTVADAKFEVRGSSFWF
jgi:hypothetical protein